MRTPPRRPGIARTSIARLMSERARPGAAPAEAQAAGAEPLAGLMDGLKRLAEALARDAAGPQAGQGERAVEIGSREGRMVFGYSVRMGLDGAKAEPFGHVAPRPAAAPAAAAARTPITDLFEEAEAIVVVAELPGAAEPDIALAVADGALAITVAGAHPYAARLALPGPVDAAGLSRSLRNGILEVRLPRAGAGR